MKILVLSNVYPPYFIGGYELACWETVEGLKAAGHQVAILTSSYGVQASGAIGVRRQASGVRRRSAVSGRRSAVSGQPSAVSGRWAAGGGDERSCAGDEGTGVYRVLYYHTVPRFAIGSMRQRALVEWGDVRALRKVLAAERPELIYVWNMGGLTRSLLEVAHAYPAPVVYDIFDGWLSQAPDVYEWAEFWQRPSLHPVKRYLKGPAKQIVGRVMPIDAPALELRHIVFKSRMLKRLALQFGMPVADAPVIYHGVNRAVFQPPASRETAPGTACRVLYAGQLAPHKGVHTVIEAFARLARDPACAGTSLTIAGGSIHPDYVAELREAVAAQGVGERVRFHNLVPRYELPPLYHAHDVLVFPSTWEEPFGLTQVEAMACGLPVIGTGTGGSAEILTDDTALRFPPGDAAALAERIARLAADPERRRRMGAAAAERVAAHFDLAQTLGETEAYLQEVVSRPRPALPATPWKMPLPTGV